VVGALTLTACEVRVDVAVDAAADGSGVVRVGVGLDDEAVGQVPDLGSQLEVDDLRETGWTVSGPVAEDDGFTWIRASKPFSDPAEASVVMAEISGPDGPFRDFGLTRERSTYEDRLRFTGTVDLESGLDGFGDADVRDRLGGSVDDLAPQLGANLRQLRESFRFRVAVLMPGAISSNAPTEVGGGAVWSPQLGERIDLVAEAHSVRWSSVAFTALAGLALVALVVVLMVRGIRRRRPATLLEE
jgi:hypothetical protein